MKIGIFTDAYEPHISGVTTSIKMLKTALEKMHHQVYIVTANLISNKFKYDEENKVWTALVGSVNNTTSVDVGSLF